MSRNLPAIEDDDQLAATSPSARLERKLDRRARTKKRDLLTVGVLTPTLLLGILVGALVLSQTFYPDTYAEPTVAPTPTLPPFSERPTPVPVAQPIDTARLNAGIVDKPPTFEWPEIDGWKAQPDPGRPSEHADYVPALSNTDVRRLIAASSVNIVMHSNPQFAQSAAEELAKPYPLRETKQRVVDTTASAGYLPDDSAFAVVFVYFVYRVQIETTVASPPLGAGNRSAVEYQTLHLADHLLRRLQEGGTATIRTAPEATAVHLRDHVARMLPFGR